MPRPLPLQGAPSSGVYIGLTITLHVFDSYISYILQLGNLHSIQMTNHFKIQYQMFLQVGTTYFFNSSTEIIILSYQGPSGVGV